MDDYLPIYLSDILKAIQEVESYFENRPKRFDDFVGDFRTRSAVERKIEIMGEAINRVLHLRPDFPLAEAKDIINTRNRIIHEYDAVRPEFLWSLIIRHIPALKENLLKASSELGYELE
ncbi:MAG: DUF86 domain-containing protein [Bacteroidales bacterium]|nr:DUF86 domain-containing protein [Bacteroidales bacterium]